MIFPEIKIAGWSESESRITEMIVENYKTDGLAPALHRSSATLLQFTITAIRGDNKHQSQVNLNINHCNHHPGGSCCSVVWPLNTG